MPALAAAHRPDSDPPSEMPDHDVPVRLALVEREVRVVRSSLEDAIERVETGMRDGFAAIDRRLAEGAVEMKALAVAQARAEGVKEGVPIGWKIAVAILGVVATVASVAAFKPH